MEIQTVHLMQIRSQFIQWRFKLVHTMNPRGFRKWRSEGASQNGSLTWVHIREITTSSRNGDASRFTQWRSRPLHTMEIHDTSHNGDPRRFSRHTPPQ